MTPLMVAKWLGAYALGAYAVDVLARPAAVAATARAYGRFVRKPVINVGAGTPGSSLRAALLGPTLWGDVNMDIAAPKAQPRPGMVVYGDAHRIPYPDRHFSALIASHVLEHMRDPQAAMREWHRVADEVFVIVPKWWAPHTWAHPGHRWFISDSGQLTELYGGGRA